MTDTSWNKASSRSFRIASAYRRPDSSHSFLRRTSSAILTIAATFRSCLSRTSSLLSWHNASDTTLPWIASVAPSITRSICERSNYLSCSLSLVSIISPVLLSSAMRSSRFSLPSCITFWIALPRIRRYSKCVAVNFLSWSSKFAIRGTAGVSGR